MLESRSPRALRVRWLGLDVEIETDDEELGRLVTRHFDAAAAAPTDGPAPTRYAALLHESEPFLEGPLGRLALDRRSAVWHAYHRLVDEIFGRVRSHFILHAAAVVRDGEAILVSAPSTYGKSTLAAALVARGFGLLADDVAAIDRSSGLVERSTRAVQLRSGARDLLPEGLVRDASVARVGVDGDAWLVDPERWVACPAAPARVRVAAVLRGPGEGVDTRRLDRVEIAVRQGCEGYLAALIDGPGVSDARRGDDDPRRVSLRLEDPAILASWLRHHRDDLVSLRRVPDGAPDFAGRPLARPMGTFQAALELAQEMLNRHVGSRLAAEFAGAEALLVAELAACLRGASCLALSPGRLDDTAETLVRAFEDRRDDSPRAR